MNAQFLIAKLAATANDTAWAQAYSTLNFYVVLSISVSEKHDKSVAQIGKETLEKLQREYFSLDEKTLENIKKAVQIVIDSIDKEASYSLVLATNIAETLYIVTASVGQVVIQRQGKLGIIAKGETESIIGFSGALQDGDIAIIQTGEFAHKISLEELKPLITSPNVTEISENIAPLLQSDANGAEAVILLQYVTPEEIPMETPIIDDGEESMPDTDEQNSEPVVSEPKVTESVMGDDNVDEDVKQPEKSVEDPKIEERNTHKDAFILSPDEIESETKKRTRPSPLTILSFVTGHKKLLLLAGIVILIGVLAGSILTQSTRKENLEAQQAINQAVENANLEYEEGLALEDLNRPLALEKFTGAQKILQDTKAKYSDHDDISKLNELLSKVDQKVGGVTSGKKVENAKSILTAKDAKLQNFKSLTLKDGTFAIADTDGTIVMLSEDGDVTDTYSIDAEDLIALNANSESVFALFRNSIVRVDASTGEDTELTELDDALQDIDVFGSNVYTVNSGTNEIEKRAPSGYGAASYVQEELAQKPISLAIDGSVYVLFDDGSIKKFTRGVDDTFAVKGAQGKINNKGLLYIQEDFSNLYVLDQTNQRIIVISTSGEVKQEFSWDMLKNASDFAVDEENKTIYVATTDNLYSFTF